MLAMARFATWMVLSAALTGTLALTAPAQAAKVVHTAHKPAATVAHQSRRGGEAVRLAGRRHGGSKYTFGKGSKVRYASAGRVYYGGLQCVPFARAASGIELKGNAANWWDAAAGVYDRGQAPEAGSVLNFRSVGRMRLGHVAVVTAVADARHIEIEHANWAGPGANKGGVSHNIPVEDVSANNDWTAVRVGLGRGGDYGSTYPTYGFIYDRPDTGSRYASRSKGFGAPTAQTVSYDEVAQAPAGRGGDLPADSPAHSVR